MRYLRAGFLAYCTPEAEIRWFLACGETKTVHKPGASIRGGVGEGGGERDCRGRAVRLASRERMLHRLVGVGPAVLSPPPARHRDEDLRGGGGERRRRRSTRGGRGKPERPARREDDDPGGQGRLLRRRAALCVPLLPSRGEGEANPKASAPPHSLSGSRGCHGGSRPSSPRTRQHGRLVSSEAVNLNLYGECGFLRCKS